VGIGRDQTLFALRQGLVRFWYDLPRSRHYVCVDDGSLPTPIMPSKDEAKRRLAHMVDLEKYMGLRGEERHRYLMKLVRKYDQQLRKEVLEVAERWISGEMIGASKDSELAAKITGRRVRKMNLVDLTKL
jgi:ribosomal protein L27